MVELLVGVAQGEGTGGWAGGFGRKLSIGAVVGVGVGDDLHAASSSQWFQVNETPESNSLVAGLMLEVALHGSLSLEADGLYRLLHAVDSSLDGRVRFAVLTWEFPVLAKYRLPTIRALRPVAELGPTFRADGNFNGPTPSHYGAAAGVGVEARVGRLKIAPTLRDTYWARERTALSPFRPSTRRNEVELLVTLSF
jgi:hypothetical protein